MAPRRRRCIHREAGQAIFAELFPNQRQLWIDSYGDGAADVECYTGELQLDEAGHVLQTLDGTGGADSKRGSAVDDLMVGHAGDDVFDGSGGLTACAAAGALTGCRAIPGGTS